MSLINCPECGREVSDQARRCPQCGHPLRSHHNRAGAKSYTLAIIGGIIAVFVGLLFFTCPDQEAHQIKVKKLAQEAITSTIADEGDDFATGLAVLFGGKIIDYFVGELLEVNNYGVVSIGRVINPQDATKSKPISIGVLGHVFLTTDKDKLMKEMQKDKSSKTDKKEDIEDSLNL